MKKIIRWLGIGGIGALLLAQGCAPQQLSMQITSVVNCGQSPLSEGVLDVSVVDYYKMTVKAVNMLAMMSDTSKYAGEPNFIVLKKAKVWFDYPKGFSQGANPQLHQENSPRETSVFAVLEPTIQAGLLGGGTGGGGGAASISSSSGTDVSLQLIPAAMSKILLNSAELNVLPNPKVIKPQAPSFYITAHVVLTGETTGGNTITSEEILFPIMICKGCLDGQKKEANCSSGTGAGAGSECVGQDGSCYEPQKTSP